MRPIAGTASNRLGTQKRTEPKCEAPWLVGKALEEQL